MKGCRLWQNDLTVLQMYETTSLMCFIQIHTVDSLRLNRQKELYISRVLLLIKLFP